MKSNQAVVVGVGEIVWDHLPSGKRLGGAPTNFVCHAHRLGAEAYLVTAIGQVSEDKEVLRELDRIGVNRDYVHTSDIHPIGTVGVEFDESGDPSYTLPEDCAWDFLPWTGSLADLASRADAVCFGTVCQRRAVSRETIQRFLHATRKECLRVFDVNLRRPHYTREVIHASLEVANVLKLNEDELPIIADLMKVSGDRERVLKTLIHTFDLSCVALTLGAEGSVMITKQEMVHSPGIRVKVKDVLGAGDAFTAAMVMGILRGLSLQETNAFACRVGAFVCSCEGAIPDLPSEFTGRTQ